MIPRGISNPANHHPRRLAHGFNRQQHITVSSSDLLLAGQAILDLQHPSVQEHLNSGWSSFSITQQFSPFISITLAMAKTITLLMWIDRTKLCMNQWLSLLTLNSENSQQFHMRKSHISKTPLLSSYSFCKVQFHDKDKDIYL